MKTGKSVLFFGLITLCVAAVFAQTEADFQTAVNKNGSVTITKYTGWDADVTIPAKIGGKVVTAIGNGAFKECDLTGVVIPEGVKIIGADAFEGNHLTSITIPNSVTHIRMGAFAENPLTSATLPANISLADNAFDEFITDWAEKETSTSYYAINGKKAGTYTRRLGEYGYNVWKFKAR